MIPFAYVSMHKFNCHCLTQPQQIPGNQRVEIMKNSNSNSNVGESHLLFCIYVRAWKGYIKGGYLTWHLVCSTETNPTSSHFGPLGTKIDIAENI